MKSAALLVTALLFCAAIFWLYRRGSSVRPEKPLPSEAIVSARSTPASNRPMPETASSEASSRSRTRREVPIREMAPRADVLQAEVRDNPHVTPPALLRFAARVADRMQRARTSKASAATLINEFDDCVRDDHQVESVQVICFLNARRLAQFHPSLESKWESVREHASPAVLKLAHAMDELGGGPQGEASP